MTSKSDILDIMVTVHRKTSMAVLVSEDGDIYKAVWLPLSEIEIEYSGPRDAEVQIPQWLAEERGLA